MRDELVRHWDRSKQQDALLPLLKRQAYLYTMGDSTSLPLETAEDLLHSIEFTIETGLCAAGESSPGLPLAQLYERGGRELWRLTEAAKELYALAKRTDPGYGSIALQDTLSAMEGFFAAYDLRFFAHDIPCMIDYPLSQPVPETLEGVRFIGEYLRRLILEQRFCRCFGHSEAVHLLRRWSPAYRELVLNLFEPIFTCAMGLALCKKNPSTLHLSAEDGRRLYEQLHPWREKAHAPALQEAAAQVCAHFGWQDPALHSYLQKAAERLMPLLKSTSREGYANLFCLV